jgi:hypothetical protein
MYAQIAALMSVPEAMLRDCTLAAERFQRIPPCSSKRKPGIARPKRAHAVSICTFCSSPGQ